MSLNFPSSPAVGEIYVSGDRTWVWNGRYWRASSTTIGFTGSKGDQGIPGEFAALGYTGSQGNPGTGFNFTGTAPTVDDLEVPYLGNVNDLYLVEESGFLWIWDGSSWGPLGRFTGYTGSRGIQGPAGGFTGSQGIQGPVGFRGSQGFTGSAGTGLDSWTVVTQNYLAKDGNRIIADTTNGSFVIVLPLNPPIGTYVVLTDGNDWGTNPVIVSPNGASIEGFTEDLTIDVSGVSIEFIWDGTQWQITATIGSAGIGVPEGGTTGQVLAKVSDADYDTAWISTVGSNVARFVNLAVIGEIAPPTTGIARFYPVQPIVITRVHASVSLPPQGAPFTFQLNKNGVSTGTVFSIAIGAYTMVPVFVNISLTTAEFLTVDITGAGSRDLHIKMEYI